jgi:hypothetical protein
MDKHGRVGWLMLLSSGSNWGNVANFLDDLESTKRDKVITVESDVWGKLRTKELKPRPGDGFAFYHTSRAEFPRSDPHHRRPRISVIGELEDSKQDGQKITWISVRIQRVDLERMRSNPIIRDKKTEHFFQQCGMVKGSVATFYKVPSEVWVDFRTLAGLNEALPISVVLDETDHELSAFEGELKQTFVLHRKREARLRAAKISAVLSASVDKCLCCEVPGCGFDFEHTYGDIGHEYAEVHHLKPLSDMSSQTITRLDDLAIVCANCHRMIHRGGMNRPMNGLIKEPRGIRRLAATQ